MKRLTDIVEKIMEARRKARAQQAAAASSSSAARGIVDVDNIEMYPYFLYHVKDLFYKFVDNIAKVTKTKSIDEFYSTRTIYWDLTEFADRNLPMDRSDPEETRNAVAKLATDLFEEIKKRITKNVLLKFYNFFLVPMQTELWNEIQGQITTLGDQSLDHYFELNATKEKLNNDVKSLEAVLKRCAEQEVSFMEAATQFSHPLITSQE